MGLRNCLLHMFEKFKKWAEDHREFLILAFAALIVMIYLHCECLYCFSLDNFTHGIRMIDIIRMYLDMPYYFLTSVVNGVIIILAYLTWKSYNKENSPVAISILLSGIAAILPFGDGIYLLKNWTEWGEKMFAFVLLLWPVVITWLGNLCMHRLSKNRRLIFGVNISIVFVFALAFHLFIESMCGGKPSDDLCMPIIWMTENILWMTALNSKTQGKQRKKRMMAAWLFCLFLFACFTYAEAVYLMSSRIWGMIRGNYWNRVIFLCWPVLLAFALRMLVSKVNKDRPYAVQKISLIYFFMVLTLVLATTYLKLNYGAEGVQYDVCRAFYMLFLAVLVIWNEYYMELEHTGSRVKALLFMIAADIGFFIVLLAQNERLREILHYIGFPFQSSSRIISQADWGGYRKAAFHAFLSNDLTVLDSMYGSEHYKEVLHIGHGLASIRFRFGMMPLLAMILLLLLLVILLWNWNRNNAFLHRCARYLAVGYILKMIMSVILQMNMVQSFYMEFPFTGTDIAELLVLILLVYEGKNIKNKEGA